MASPRRRVRASPESHPVQTSQPRVPFQTVAGNDLQARLQVVASY